jgi:tRNA G10  N-methylase Trm11
MVGLAGPPSGLLLDPCCGSGTILTEGRAIGWQVEGRDIDSEAVAIAQENVPGVVVRKADARSVDLADGSVAACVSNLPFGQQYGVDGPMDRWQQQVIAELLRITRPGGRLVLLAPDLPNRGDLPGLGQIERHPIRLLGTATTIWAFDRT